jgi:hypothetical protein
MRSVITVTAAAALAVTAASPARADEESLRREFDEKLRRALDEQETRHRAEMDALRAQLKPAGPAATTELQDRIDDLVAEMGKLKSSWTAAPTRAAFRLVDLSIVSSVVAGASTGGEGVIQALEQGGHDPKERGFTMPNVELVATGAVDPYFNAQVNIVTLLSPEGETELELEEAFATTTSEGRSVLHELRTPQPAAPAPVGLRERAGREHAHPRRRRTARARGAALVARSGGSPARAVVLGPERQRRDGDLLPRDRGGGAAGGSVRGARGALAP